MAAVALPAVHVQHRLGIGRRGNRDKMGVADARHFLAFEIIADMTFDARVFSHRDFVIVGNCMRDQRWLTLESPLDQLELSGPLALIGQILRRLIGLRHIGAAHGLQLLDTDTPQNGGTQQRQHDYCCGLFHVAVLTGKNGMIISALLQKRRPWKRDC